MPVTWPGPRPYTDALSSVFRGRDKDVARALDQVRGQRLSLMTASSGAGKTSLLQAGVIPKIRSFRLVERSSGRAPVAPFPLLVNEWLERAGKGESMDFSHLLILEMYGSLRKSRDWYRACSPDAETAAAATAEVEAIEAAMNGLADFAEAEGFARRTEDDGPLAWAQSDTEATSRDMTDRLLKAIDVVSAPMGEILLIFDQFEEILLDWRLGQQAQDAVEGLFRLRRTTLRQLISMRDDGVHLIKPLEKKGVLERKREFEIKPLSASAVERILNDVGADAGHPWDETPLSSGVAPVTALVDAFTQTRTGGGIRAGEVNLVGLQVVLNAVFEDVLQQGDAVTAEALERYCNSLAAGDGSLTRQNLREWLDVDNDSGLVRLAPLTWITRCLAGKLNVGGGTAKNVFELLVQPLAARMSTQLVTPGGNKRTMTRGELHDLAYGNVAEQLKKHDLAGVAAADGWDTSDYLRVMRATADEALGRLTTGNVLKRRGSETGQDIAYELVHDQFGRPFQDWAVQYKRTPENDLSSLTAIRSTEFTWSGDLRPHDDDGVIPFAKWIDCTLNDVNFSDLRFVNCDFGECIFNRCTFADATFEDCDLTNASFKDCRFVRAEFAGSALTSTRWLGRTTLESVVVAGGEGGMAFAQLIGAALTDCRFAADAEPGPAGTDKKLPMHYVQFVDCDFSGTVTFDHCDLGSVVLKGMSRPAGIDGALRFLNCQMPGAELSNLDMRGAALDLIDCDCRAAVFANLDGGPDTSGKVADIAFSHTQLTGAAMVACKLHDVDFVGPGVGGHNQSVVATAFTIRGQAGADGSIVAPSKLVNLNFTGLVLKNLTIEGCEIEGDITFDACSLVGAEIIGLPGPAPESRAFEVGGTILLKNKCDADAMRFERLRFTPAHPLVVRDCAVSGALFLNVEFDGKDLAEPAGVFSRTEMGGSSFLGCHIHAARFEGAKNREGGPGTLMPSVAVLPSPHASGSTGSIGPVSFRDIFMPGFLIRDVALSGDVAFVNCDLGGSGIKTSKTDERTLPRVDGELAFTSCAMDGFELRNLQFADKPLCMTDCDCNGAILSGLSFSAEQVGNGGWLVARSNLSGALLLDCRLTNVRLSGASGKSTALGLAVRGTSDGKDRPASVGDCLVKGYVLDGATFEGLKVSDALTFNNCSLLRAKFWDLAIEGDATFDLRGSDVLYAEVDPALMANNDGFLINDDQRQAIVDQAKHEAALRLARTEAEDRP